MRVVGTLAAVLVLATLGVALGAGVGGSSLAQPAEAPPKAERSPTVIVVPPAGTPPKKRPGKRAEAPAKTPVPAAGAVPVMRPATPDQEYKDCLTLWDKGTHMTRAEWAATCRRIQTRLNSVTGLVQATPGRRRAR